jgi:TPR repeat protein
MSLFDDDPKAENARKPSLQSEDEMWAYIEEQEDLLNQLGDIFAKGRRKPHEGVLESPAPFTETEQLAIEGDPAAQFNLSAAYSKGDGVSPDFEKAAYWLLHAAKGGFAPAQYNLACYWRDNNDSEKAIEWFMLAAKQNFGPAQFKLGNTYGNAGDCAAAFVWFSLAAQNRVDHARENRDKAAALLSKDDLNAARLCVSALMMDFKGT